MNIAVADLPDNLISGEEIVDKFMSRSMLSFMEKHFR